MENFENRKWTTKELQEEFKVLSFSAPYVEVIHKETDKKGTLEFDHSPRIYYNFIEDIED